MVLKEYRGWLAPNNNSAYRTIDLHDKKYIKLIEIDWMVPNAAAPANGKKSNLQVYADKTTTGVDAWGTKLSLISNISFDHNTAVGQTPRSWGERGSIKGRVGEGITIVAHSEDNMTFHYRAIFDIRETK